MRTIDEEIKNKNFKSLYLLYGDEPYLVSFYKKRLVAAIGLPTDDMNFAHYTRDNFNGAAIIDECETMPFFAERRVVLVEDSGIFMTPDDKLSEYVGSVPESCILIFVEGKVDKRTAAFKSASGHGTVTELNTPGDEELKMFIAREFGKAGLGITRDACNELMDRTSESMYLLMAEIAKLSAYCMGRQGVTVEDVKEITPEHPEGKVFHLINAMGEKNYRKALDLYKTLLAMQEKAAGILYLIQKQFQSMYYLDSMMERRLSRGDMMERLGIPERMKFKYDQLMRQIRNFDRASIRAILKDSSDFIAATHSGRITDEAAVELLITKYGKPLDKTG